MSPTSTVTGYTINDLVAVLNGQLELPGALFEIEVPRGPIAGAYVNKKLTAEQLCDYVQSLIGSAAGVSAFQLDPNTYFVSPALQAVALTSLVWLHPDYTTSTVAGSYPPNRAPILATTGRPADGSVLAYIDAGANIVPIPLSGAMSGGLQKFTFLTAAALGNGPYSKALATADLDSFIRVDTPGDTTITLPPPTTASLGKRIVLLHVAASGSGQVLTISGVHPLARPAGALALETLQTVGVEVVEVFGSPAWVVTSRSGGTGLPAGTTFRDPLAIGDNLAVTAAVLDASNTWSNGDLTAYGSAALSDKGAPPAVSGQNSTILVGTADVQNGDQFEGIWPVDNYAYTFFYGRRTDGTSGWTMHRKGRADVFASPDGNHWQISVNNSGNLVTTQL